MPLLTNQEIYAITNKDAVCIVFIFSTQKGGIIMNEWNKRCKETARSTEEMCGFHHYGTAGMRYERYHLYVLFVEGRSRHEIDITKQCRDKFGRLDANKRSAIEASMPDTIKVDVDKFDGKGYVYSLDETDLDNWLESVQL